MLPWEVRAPFALGRLEQQAGEQRAMRPFSKVPFSPRIHRLLTWGGFLVVVTFVCRLLGYKNKVQDRYNLLL